MYRIIFAILFAAYLVAGVPNCGDEKNPCSNVKLVSKPNKTCEGKACYGEVIAVNNDIVINVTIGTHGRVSVAKSDNEGKHFDVPSNFVCPHDHPKRSCYLARSLIPDECQTDEECAQKKGQLMKCCMDFCLQHKTCKTPLILVN